ncbi:MAG: hypothetical protein IJF83_07010 [Methanobrevibacter sp.]|nr:hypothetical protein [Methanobrevibacter sp.]
MGLGESNRRFIESYWEEDEYTVVFDKKRPRGDERLCQDEVIDLLNELWEENQKMKNQIKDMPEDVARTLREEVYKRLTENLPRNGELCSFAVNTDYLEKKLDEMYPGFEVEINQVNDIELEIVFKKMVNVISIEIDNDKIMEEIQDGR